MSRPRDDEKAQIKKNTWEFGKTRGVSELRQLACLLTRTRTIRHLILRLGRCDIVQSIECMRLSLLPPSSFLPSPRHHSYHLAFTVPSSTRITRIMDQASPPPPPPPPGIAVDNGKRRRMSQVDEVNILDSTTRKRKRVSAAGNADGNYDPGEVSPHSECKPD